MKQIKSNSWEYMKDGLAAEGHTPIYKMHKYFARRPQNVFSELIKNYSAEGDIILDPFCGGGVTEVEGLALGRRVVGNDINPLAVFITKCEITKVPLKQYWSPMSEVLEEVRSFSEPLFSTQNRDTNNILPVRWYEHAYVVKCPHCGKETVLSNENKKLENDKLINGWYTCTECGEDIQAANENHVGHKMLTVTYKVSTRKTQRTVLPNEYDFQMEREADKLYSEKIENGDWEVPDIHIPQNWDRQQEDCLLRKGFFEFKDFFTKRTLLVMSYFLQRIKARKGIVSDEVYDLLLLTFSATLRYTNNMTISTSQWQDGRPVAWAKHAYWMSYQFVEVNPVEYIEKRMSAIKAALIFQKEKFKSSNHVVDSFSKIMNYPDSCLLLNQDSSTLPIPDESIDLVLTDPPYGGNVQYGELSAFWLAWIYDELGISKDYITQLTGEILVQRKNKVKAKTYETYYEGLRRVYSEAYRVLKKGQPLVFTFNSKDTKVWLAVLKAVIDSGFVLEKEGLIYQSPIENYKNTAHTMAPGTVHGDFIYTFVKPLIVSSDPFVPDVEELQKSIVVKVDSTIQAALNGSEGKTISELYIAVLKEIIPLMAQLAMSKENFDFINNLLGGKLIEETIKRQCVATGNNLWKLEK